jgi:hypothetical protein
MPTVIWVLVPMETGWVERPALAVHPRSSAVYPSTIAADRVSMAQT